MEVIMAGITDLTSKVTEHISVSGVVQTGGWIVGTILVVLVAGGLFLWWWNGKKFNKNISVFELVSGHYEPIYKDVATVVKLGKGGFEILYLKNLKTYRIAYGGRIGKSTYYFFIAPDGLWHNCLLGGEITVDGRVAIITTNPNMRGGYTSLETDIHNLTGGKQNWWEKYGAWALTFGFLAIIGVFSWLILKEYSAGIGQLPTLIDKTAELIDKVNHLLVSVDAHNSGATAASGLVKVNGG